MGVLLPYLVAVLAWFIYKTLFYHFWPLGSEERSLGVMEQVYRMVGSAKAVEPMGVIRWPFIGWLVPCWIRPTFLSLWIKPFSWLPIAVAGVLAGTMAQLLFAEDMHRLTGFLFIGWVMFALWI